MRKAENSYADFNADRVLRPA